MTTPDTITRRRLCADCGQLRVLTPFEGALLCQPCAEALARPIDWAVLLGTDPQEGAPR